MGTEEILSPFFIGPHISRMMLPLNRRQIVLAGTIAALAPAATASPAAPVGTQSSTSELWPGSPTGDARRVSASMQGALLAFARSGDPNFPDLARWEPYTLPRRATMVFNVDSPLTDDPRGAERQLFAKVPFIQLGT
jgi:hypothetical protein